VVKGKFEEEQKIIDDAVAVRHCIPNEVRIYLSHFLRNYITEILYHSGYYKGECKPDKVHEVVEKIDKVLKRINI